MEEEVEEKKVWTAKFGLKAFFSPQPLKNSGWNDILHFLQPPKKRFFRKQNYLNWIFFWNEMIMMMKEKFFIHEFKLLTRTRRQNEANFLTNLQQFLTPLSVIFGIVEIFFVVVAAIFKTLFSRSCIKIFGKKSISLLAGHVWEQICC